MKTSAHTISSSGTFFIKFVLPAVWLGQLSSVAILIYSSLYDSSQISSSGIMDAVKCVLPLLIIIVGSIVARRTWMHLKRVRLDDKVLYISNYLTEIVVPLTNVSKVDENIWWQHHPVTIYFHVDTKFGTQVTFMPKSRFLAPQLYHHHPVVDEIRMAVNQANGYETKLIII